jgi:hypothetical protein
LREGRKTESIHADSGFIRGYAFELDANMKPRTPSFGINRRALLSTLAALPALSGTLLAASAQVETVPPGGVLPSWNEGPAKQAILDFVRATTDQASPKFVPPAERIATFDQDGTLWVEHPMYTFMTYALERVPALAKAKQRGRAVQNGALRQP